MEWTREGGRKRDERSNTRRDLHLLKREHIWMYMTERMIHRMIKPGGTAEELITAFCPSKTETKGCF